MGSDSQFGDTTYTKIFVGGLAWGTQRDTMKSYFEQFGEILEAVVIVDKHTGRSKGYGFVTFKDPDSAIKACQDRYPVIDGRRTNCNLAAFGAQKNGPTTAQRGLGKFRSSTTMTMARPARSSLDASTYIYTIPEYTLPYYGYTNYPQDISTMNYYNAYGEQEFPIYYVVGSHNEFLPAYCCWYIPPRMDSRANPKTTESPSHHVSQQYEGEATGVTIGTAKGPGDASEQNSLA
ncbi:Splicing factor-like protein [Parasponia andersonii]|uniref:Splicing factor-like protein n=1 Tax=Parasponia andersonii TaxID=3476 RepID=A0A2P5DFB0_PARAD|nr:Splicing factor-like protein [Parasponia andersonii]